METWFNGPVCGGVDPELTLYKANACLAFYDEGGVRRFMKNECFVDTKMGQRSYYVDEACTIPDSTWTTDVGPADTCLGSVVLSCQFDASILRNVRHSEMFVLFEDQAAMEANNLPSAKMFIIDAPTSTLRNLKDSQKMSCNSKIGYGHCVDTTNAESYARLQLSFQTNAVSLYSKRNGLGKVSRVELPPSSKEQDGDVMALRFPVRDWYDVYFGPTGPQTMVDLAEVDVADI